MMAKTKSILRVSIVTLVLSFGLSGASSVVSGDDLLPSRPGPQPTEELRIADMKPLARQQRV